MTRSVREFASSPEMIRAGAEEFVGAAAAAIGARGVFRVALSGGNTPRALHEALADPGLPFRAGVDWSRVRFFFGDERHVPPDHPDSNYRMAQETLFSKIPVDPASVARFRAEWKDPETVATGYEEILKQSFELGPGAAPRFDLVLLGMGADGHTASLFPGSPVLHETRRLVAAPWVEKLGSHRFTLTPVVLNRAAHVVFLVSGADKVKALHDVLEGPRDPDRLPAQIVQPDDGTVLWLVEGD